MILLRIFFAIIIVIIYLILLIIIPKKFIYKISQFFSQKLLWVCGLNNIIVTNKFLFDYYINKKKPFIIICNHISLWDGIILTSIFGNVRYLASKTSTNVFIGAKYCLNKLDCLFVEKENTVNKIKENLNSDNVLVIFPDAMEQIPSNQCIADFKTGAFAVNCDILPIIIKYDNYTVNPTFYWYKKENPLHSWIKILSNNDITIKVKVLPLIRNKEGRNITKFKNKVHKYMSNEYKIL